MKIKITNYGNRYERPWCVFLENEDSILRSAWAFFDTEAEARTFAQGFAEMLAFGIQVTLPPLH